MKVYALRSVPVRSLLKWAELAPSSFYYKRSGGRKGIKPSTHSLTVQGERMENKAVIVELRDAPNMPPAEKSAARLQDEATINLMAG